MTPGVRRNKQWPVVVRGSTLDRQWPL